MYTNDNVDDTPQPVGIESLCGYECKIVFKIIITILKFGGRNWNQKQPLFIEINFRTLVFI